MRYSLHIMFFFLRKQSVSVLTIQQNVMVKTVLTADKSHGTELTSIDVSITLQQQTENGRYK